MIMTTTAPRPPKAERRARYTILPNPPKKIDMQQRPHVARAHTILEKRYEDDPATLVGSEGYLKYDANERSGFAVPDCVVAFGVEADAIIEARGYVINEVGKPPDFVLEIASETTGVRDYTTKRRMYRRLLAGEYWRFDSTGGRYYDAPLAGDILVDGEYRRIDIRRDPDGSLWGYSPALGLYLVWQDGILRFFDPETGEFLRDLSESEKLLAETGERLEQTETRLEQTERQRASERAARYEAEHGRHEAEQRAESSERRAESSERRAASERAARNEAERRAAAAEAEIERLRRLLSDSE